MGTVGWVTLGLLLGLVSPFMILHLQRRRDLARAGGFALPREHRPEVVRPRNPFAAVSIRPCAEKPCEAVLNMQNTRYLAVRAPPLPVPGCDSGRCGCRYVRHADRRRPGDRRDSLARFGGLTPAGKNRRGAREGRRSSD